MRIITIPTCVLMFLTSAAMEGQLSVSAAEAARRSLSERLFRTQVAPLLARHCLDCHDARSRQGGLNLEHKSAAVAGGDSGPPIVAGKSGDSLLWQYVEAEEMPRDRPPLSADEKKALRQWIDSGAVWNVTTIERSTLATANRPGYDQLRRLTASEYIRTVRDAVGVDVEAEARRLLPPDQRADGFRNTAYHLQVDLEHVQAYARLAELIAGQMDVMKFAAEHVPARLLADSRSKWPASGGSRGGRRAPPSEMADVIAAMGRWLLRGPLEPGEIAAFTGVAAAVAREGGDFSEALQYVVQAMLQSPRFVYRVERRPRDAGGKVSGEELASRLSYIVWGGPPDKELLRAAAAGQLSQPAACAAQVQRMLRDPRAVTRSLEFVHDWLDLEKVGHLRPDRRQFPGWDPQLAADMRAETLAFFEEVAWKQNRPLWELMNAPVTFVTPRLAEHYGLPAATGAAVTSPAGTSRVTSGLQVLYTFAESRGELVRDGSGANPAIDLKITASPAIRWSGQGLVIGEASGGRAAAAVASQAPPARLIGAARGSGAITLEAWITPASGSQAGPARILTLSSDPSNRNFTLGQAGDRFEVRLRTTATSNNGEPSLSSAAGTAGTGRVHVIYTRTSSGDARLYVDGSESAKRQVGGDFSNWDRRLRLAVGNELTQDRLWQGTLHLVAIYDRALTAAEVRQNHAAGLERRSGPAPPAADPASRRDLLALYRFDEGGGDTIHDRSGAGPPLDLKIANPAAIRWEAGRLVVHAHAHIETAAPPDRLIAAVKKSNAVTLLAWVTPAGTRQSGPARIVTLSSGTGLRNFTLGQDGDRYEVRFRSSRSDANGLPGLASPSGTLHPRPTFIAYTRDAAGQARLYLDGQEQAARVTPGDLANWDQKFRLMLANESSRDRPWLGAFHTVAVYGRALSADEIRTQHQRGTGPAEPQPRAGGVARYDLTGVPERGGLLTQGSLLTVGGDEASMVARGLFVLQELLDSRVGNPPPCADTTPVPTKAGLTQRAIAESRIANQACGGCHVKFEPLAFGLERFDGLGAFRRTDHHGNRLREDGEIVLPGSGQPVSYRTSGELMDVLAGSERVRRTITRKLTQFALGRPLTEADADQLERIHAAAVSGGGTYASLITAIVTSDLVQTTHAETSE